MNPRKIFLTLPLALALAGCFDSETSSLNIDGENSTTDNSSSGENSTTDNSSTDNSSSGENGSDVMTSGSVGFGPDISHAYTPATTALLPEQPKTAAQTTATSAYGVISPVDFYINQKDNSVDVFWADAGEAASQWNITNHTSFTDPTIVNTIAIPSSVNQAGRFLGFGKKEADDTYFIAYSKDNGFAVRSADGVCERVNGSRDNCDGEYWFTGFNATGEKFSTSIFGSADLTVQNIEGEATKGTPGSAAVGNVLYHEATDQIILYTGHTMRWDDNIRHQASWIASFNSNGQLNNLLSGWYISHNFDQRLHRADDTAVYTLAHGDAFPRELVLGKWDLVEAKRLFDYSYYDIQFDSESKTNNVTKADTGDIAVIDNDRVAIAFSTEDTRTSRDITLKVLSGLALNDAAQVVEDVNVWLTDNTAEVTVGKGIKVVSANDKIVVMWNEYHAVATETNREGDYIQTRVGVYNLDGSVIGSAVLTDRLMPTQSLKVINNGNSVVWVTSSENSELLFHTFDLSSL